MPCSGGERYEGKGSTVLFGWRVAVQGSQVTTDHICAHVDVHNQAVVGCVG